MNLVLKIADLYIPPFIRKKGLKNLFALTASSFGCDVPATAGLSFEESLTAYARFTNTSAERCKSTGKDPAAIQERLYSKAYEFGKTLRKLLRISTPQELMMACKILYRTIGIDFHGSQNGEITIPRCFFSKYYSAPTCRLISSIDAGILAGLSGGNTLTFSQRITEGFEACKARLAPKERVR
jgi:hypothetical protein